MPEGPVSQSMWVFRYLQGGLRGSTPKSLNRRGLYIYVSYHLVGICSMYVIQGSESPNPRRDGRLGCCQQSGLSCSLQGLMVRNRYKSIH